MWQLPGPEADGAGSEGLGVNTGFCLGLAEDTVGFFPHGWTEGDGKLETHGQPSTQINHLATPQSALHRPLECFPCDRMEELNNHLHQYLKGEKEPEVIPINSCG